MHDCMAQHCCLSGILISAVIIQIDNARCMCSNRSKSIGILGIMIFDSRLGISMTPYQDLQSIKGLSEAKIEKMLEQSSKICTWCMGLITGNQALARVWSLFWLLFYHYRSHLYVMMYKLDNFAARVL